MGRGAEQILQQAPGLSGTRSLQRVLLGYDVLYLLRGAPAILYGDEIGMAGPGGDKAARQDMFPTQVSDWQTETRVGSPPIGKGSGFDVTGNPTRAADEGAGRGARRAPGALDRRVGRAPRHGAVLVVSRLDLANGHEVVTAFNNGTTPATVTVPTASPNATWSIVFGTGVGERQPDAHDPAGLGDRRRPEHGDPEGAAAAGRRSPPGADDLTAYYRLGVTGLGSSAVSVAFAIRRHGGAWQRLAIDDSAPYRAFLDPARFKKHERVDGVAVARGLDGTISSSRLASFVPNP